MPTPRLRSRRRAHCSWLLTAALLVLSAGLIGAEGLAARVDAILASAPAGAQVGVQVLDVANGRVIVDRRGDAMLRMASLTKLYVSAAALLELGPEHTMRTRLLGLGPLSADGSLPGLVVVGGGSPCLDEHFTERDPDRIFRAWAAALSAAGVRRINGDLVVDASMFTGPIRPNTWPDSDQDRQRWYSAPASALAWNDNCIEVRVVPGRPGEAGQVEVRPRSTRITVINRSRSVASGGSAGIVVSRLRDANTVVVGGRYSATTSWFPLAIHEDPDLLAGDHFAEILKESGIAVSGLVRRGQAREASEAGGVLLHEQIDPLLPAITILNTRSQNFYGEQILRVLGHERGGDGSDRAGITVIRSALDRHLGLAASGYEVIDGSGLSAGNRASAANVCQLLLAMHRSPLQASWHASLRERWSGRTQARVKTGTLSVVRALAGYIDGDNGQRHAFAIIVDRGQASGIAWADELRNRLFTTIAEAVGRR